MTRVGAVSQSPETLILDVDKTKIRFLVKFINDLDGAVFYAYPSTSVINDRYTEMGFTYSATPDLYAGRVKLLPAGYFKYEVYEVSWQGTVSVEAGEAPATEDDVLTPPSADRGIVQGLVAIGILYLGEKAGSEQVQYTEYTAPASTNTIYYGQ